MTMAARLLAPLAGLAAGITLQVDKVTPDEKIINSAIRGLEGLWPGGKGPEMLSDIMRTIPALDNGAQLQKKLKKRFETKKPFVFASFGSSVTAGHDNVMNQSWPFELERLLKPTFQNLGFDFEIRQRGAGGYGEMPFGAGCLKSRAGSGVDALSWEWHMFYDGACEGHHFLTEALAMNGHPVVFGFADSGLQFDDNLECKNGEEPRDCANTRRSLRSDILSNNDEIFGLPREWKPNQWYFGDKFVSVAEQSRFAKEGPNKFKKKDVQHSPPEMVWLQRTGVAAEFENAGGAFYPIAVSAATPHVIDDPWYQVREKAFNVNWHPGPLGHTLIAAAIGHYMLENLKLALNAESARGQGPSLDNPLVGTPITGTLDHVQCGDLRSLKCKTGMHPANGADYVNKNARAANKWEYTISRQAAEGRVPTVDERWVYRGTEADGELKLNIKTDADNQYLVVCGAPCGWNCNGNAGWVSSRSQRWWPDKDVERKVGSDLKFSIDGRPVPSAELIALHDTLFAEGSGKFCPNCKNPADLCQPVAKVGAGEHTIGATVSPHSRKEEKDGEAMFVEIFEIMVVGA